MNDSTNAHRFKIKGFILRSTHCRTDDSLAADKVSHPRRSREVVAVGGWELMEATAGQGWPALPRVRGN